MPSQPPRSSSVPPAPVPSAGATPARPVAGSSRGFTLLELLLAIAVLGTLLTMSVPMTAAALDEVRTGMAARYVEGRIMNARMLAVKRSASVALRFEPAGAGYAIAEYLDGNGNGVRAAEIAAGIDPSIAPQQALHEQFPSVVFGLRANTPDVDGARSPSDSDGIRFGTSRILSLAPDGTSSSGTVYLHGKRGQFAVRVLGATGRTRVLKFDTGTGRWNSR